MHELTLCEAAARMGAGELDPLEYARGLLRRQEAIEPRLAALAHFDRDAYLSRAARARDLAAKEKAAGRERPFLSGIPVGIKDNIDTAGVPTRAGSSLHASRVPQRDAACLEPLWRAGAYLHSKTAMTELAYFDPGPTRNPWDLAHTPGGSSSGSAAGVAAGLFPLALGTQTAGSVIRPAAYCGVVGFVPTRGRIPLEGILPFASSVDQPGVFARSVNDAAAAFYALCPSDRPSERPQDAAGPRSGLSLEPLGRAPFLGLARKYFVETAEDEMARAVIHAARALAAAGAIVHVVNLPPSFADIHRQHVRLMQVEMARAQRETFRSRPDAYGKKLSELIRAGLAANEDDYRAALAHRERFRSEAERLLSEVDALILPAAPSAAPYGLETTGDPRFSIPWTNAGAPALTLPAALGSDGLPLGLQLVGRPEGDRSLLQTAHWVEEKLGWGKRTPALK